MVKINSTYEGDLHCLATHEPTGNTIITDAPPDNQGKGETFSPTDLVATALGTCYLTIMGIAAKGRNIDMKGTVCNVEKHMTSDLPRKIAKLAVEVIFPKDIPPEKSKILQEAIKTCPVSRSLHPDVKIEVNFHTF